MGDIIDDQPKYEGKPIRIMYKKGKGQYAQYCTVCSHMKKEPMKTGTLAFCHFSALEEEICNKVKKED